MKIEWKNKLVIALLSGSYEQGCGRLKCKINEEGTEFAYCCLGVLRAVDSPCSEEMYGTFVDGYSELLSKRAMTKYGLTMTEQAGLVSMNDDGVPFDMIAGFIDEYL